MSAADGSELIGTVYYDLLDTATAEAQRASNQKVLDTQESALNTQDTFARKGGRIDAVCTQKSYTLVLDNPAVITISAMIDKMAMAKGGMKWSVDDASAKTESQPATETATTKEPETADETATAKETAEDAAKEAEPASEERSEEPDNKRSKPNTEVDEHTATTE
ncbi:hypothetical protein SARC_09168 [Sphaeroforma arctica JP610]|uniref:Uncharacterized protein n=1 Tax=Sphaeroforma arctica JP610 TaxID=667725 RepID=A0A0L0FNT1_9EUKA|nr:hypothetical protein SARC_09168 [Sphaeroforma arctica JP610]KNC78399.1 hypothetical protein SARC_09168 [Sphaeroforma arctica JP610]|eukprot:XP_014152301.1 hypothetical protein SARC_09168 [Sphaeroforma arctica JP610]